MSKEVKKWWENNSKNYQDECKIPIDIHYGPGSPNEAHYKLLGNLKGKKIFEIGCGGGQCGISMARQGAEVTAIDISENQLEFAKKLARKNNVKIIFFQGSFQNLSQIKSNSQDIVFSAYALQYSPNLRKVFLEAYRVLKSSGIFVFSLDHPFFNTIDSETLKLKRSYFKTGKYIEGTGKVKFIGYAHTIGEYYDLLMKAGFSIEKIIEPDSRKKYLYDPWYGLWNFYTSKIMNMVPPTVIFKTRKNS